MNLHAGLLLAINTKALHANKDKRQRGRLLLRHEKVQAERGKRVSKSHSEVIHPVDGVFSSGISFPSPGFRKVASGVSSGRLTLNRVHPVFGVIPPKLACFWLQPACQC